MCNCLQNQLILTKLQTWQFFFSVEERYVPLQKSNTKEYNMPLERFTIYPQQNQMELLNDCLEEKNNENDPSIIFFSARAFGLSSNWDY